MKIVIIGAGISGLAAGWQLQQQGHEVVLIEKRARAGGWIRSVEKEGFLFELGPRGFRPSGAGRATLALVHALGLSDQLIPANPEARKRYVVVGGKLCALSLPFLLRQGLVGALFRDWFAPPFAAEDAPIAQFCLTRFSKKLTNRLVDPLVKGIFGGEADALSLRSCFPSLWEAAQKGSLLRHRTRSKEKAETPLYSFRHGMETLPKALARQLTLHYSVPEVRLVPGGVQLPDRFLPADKILVAAPASVAAALAGIPDPFTYASLTSINMGWKEALLPTKGFGFLIPSEERAACLGMTWDSTIFPDQNQGAVTRLCIMMKPLATSNTPQEDSPYQIGDSERHLELAKALVARYLNITTPPDVTLVRHAPLAIPQYHVGHHKRVAAFRSACPFILLGSSYEGISINDGVAHASSLHLSTYTQTHAKVENLAQSESQNAIR